LNHNIPVATHHLQATSLMGEQHRFHRKTISHRRVPRIEQAKLITKQGGVGYLQKIHTAKWRVLWLCRRRSPGTFIARVATMSTPSSQSLTHSILWRPPTLIKRKAADVNPR